MRTRSRSLRLGLAAVAVGVTAVAFAPAASAKTSVKFTTIKGFSAPGTPDSLNKVGILKTGPRKAKNILVLNPGTSASAAYFEPFAKTLVDKVKGWQVWAVERRENYLEDQSVVNKAKEGKATPDQLFDYYLGYLTDPSITNHYQPVQDADVQFAKQWGMNVEIQDLRRVVRKAQKKAKRVVLGGHSLGGSITTAYATWDFNGKPGAKGLSGLVYDDGGSSPTPISADAAQSSLDSFNAQSSPWLAFGGIPAPFAGLFNVVGATGTHIDPNGMGKLGQWPLLPSNLKPPVPATNTAQYGYALSVGTSPSSLIAAQAHLGHLADSGDPRGWVDDGITPIRRYEVMFSGWGLKNLDGTAWYHPRRLTIDSGAVGDGIGNPAQSVLDVHATHGADLSKKLRIYAFGAALGGQGVLTAAQTLATQSGIPSKNLTLINRQATYAHNDPAGAFPKNDFIKKLVPFLKKISKKN